MFNTIDSDASGSISETELINGLREQGYAVTPSEVQQLMSRLDLDKDGDILFDEFATGLLDWKEVGLAMLPFAHLCDWFGNGNVR